MHTPWPRPARICSLSRCCCSRRINRHIVNHMCRTSLSRTNSKWFSPVANGSAGEIRSTIIHHNTTWPARCDDTWQTHLSTEAVPKSIRHPIIRRLQENKITISLQHKSSIYSALEKLYRGVSDVTISKYW